MTNWQTIIPGVATALTGLAIIVVAAMVPAAGLDSSIRSVLILAGVGMVTGGAGLAKARADATSVAAHEESMTKIAQAEATQAVAHETNVARIESLTAHVEQVPTVVAQAVQAKVPSAVAQVLNEATLRQERRS